jgi:hypothetical protein
MVKSSLPLLLVILLLRGATCSSNQTDTVNPKRQAAAKSVSYINKQYGFRFLLPSDWRGYSIVLSCWHGDALNGRSQSEKTETGPLISIRHPLWTEADPYQDILIIVFTWPQWSLVEHDELIVSAAPFGPSNIGQNAKYVFATPPRFEYAFPTGWEGVLEILRHHPLRPLAPDEARKP